MERFAADRGVRLNVVAEAEAIGAASFARKGAGFAVLPYSSANLMRSFGALDIAPISDAWAYRLLVRRADLTPSPAALVVGRLISDLFKEMIAGHAFQPDHRRVTKPRSVKMRAVSG